MVHIKRELTPEEVAKAQGDPYKLISESTIIGYGVYSARIYQEDDKHILEYERGDSCD